MNISDLESIFSTNTAYSESTTQTTLEIVPPTKKYWPPPPQLPTLNEIITSCVAAKTKQIAGSNERSNVTMVQSTAEFDNIDDNQAISRTIPVDSVVVEESSITSYLNNQDITEKGQRVIVDSVTIADVDDDGNECNQQYLCESSCCCEQVLDGRCYNYNNHKFGLDCQNMTNCGNENYNDDKETTAAAADFAASESTEIIVAQCERERGREEVIKLAERIKGEGR